MSDAPFSTPPAADDPAARLRAIVNECVSRRARGEALPDEQILAAHPALADALRRELDKLALIQKARQQAATADAPTIASGAPSGAAEMDETQVAPNSGSGRAASAMPPQALPGYEILGEIHRGGQGIVYKALQKSTKRRVAIKVLREGPFAGPADQARFDREVEILGQLKHPNIVAIHDRGAAAGCFYYVMDYIPGRSLDEWIRERQQGNEATRQQGASQSKIESALRLFLKICDAVNTAHLRGIIHRDLKPGNIRIDENSEPHVLDFGLAKVAAPLGGGTAEGLAAMTQTGQFVGSLPWASPEQAEGVPSKIDLRTDVYSLGVILYQMLTGGVFPYAVQGSFSDVLHNIRHVEPLRPSALRGEHERLARAIDDELETIVLKCLQKERERRYQIAGELARDIRHYLNNEPIEAKRDSALYVLRKQLRRYRGAMSVGLAFAVLLLTAAIVSTTLYFRAEEQARLARAAEQEQKRERDRAEDERRKAQTETAVANFRLRETRRQANDTLLEHMLWFPILRRGYEWDSFLPADVRKDYPETTMLIPTQWLKTQLPEWFLVSGEPVPEKITLVSDTIYGLAWTAWMDPADPRHQPLYDWLTAHKTRIDGIAAATDSVQLNFGPPAIIDRYHAIGDMVLLQVARSSRFVGLLIARAAQRHLDGHDATAARLLAAARRGIRLNGSSRMLAGELYEITGRHRLYEIVSVFATDAAAQGHDPTPYLRYLEIDPPPVPVTLFLHWDLASLEQKIVEAFAPDESNAVPRLQAQPLRELLEWCAIAWAMKKEEVEEKLKLLLAQRDQINFDETLAGFGRMTNFLLKLEKLSDDELSRLDQVAPVETLNPLLKELWVPLLRDLQHAPQLFRKSHRGRDGAILAVAVAMFRHQQGRWPDSLDEALTAIALRPAQRFGSISDFVYRLEEDFPLLYSFGEDRADDGGLPRWLRGPDNCYDDVYVMPPPLRRQAVERYWERQAAESP